MRKLAILFGPLLLLFIPAFIFAGQGCCSWHGGQNYCDTSVGRWVCNDGTYSPSCTCSVTKSNTSVLDSYITNPGYVAPSTQSVEYINCSNKIDSVITPAGKCLYQSGFVFSLDGTKSEPSTLFNMCFDKSTHHLYLSYDNGECEYNGCPLIDLAINSQNDTRSCKQDENMCGDNTRIGKDGYCHCISGTERNILTSTCEPVNSNYTTLQYAVARMYENHLTTYSSITNFRPSDLITRQQASKFFALFAMIVFNKSTSDTSDVSFKDLYSADKTLQSSILYAYKFGLFKGTNGYFLPAKNLTQAQTIAVLMRAAYGNMNETGTRWYDNYYIKATNIGIISGLGFDYKTLDTTNITRGDVAILLYRLYLWNSSKY